MNSKHIIAAAAAALLMTAALSGCSAQPAATVPYMGADGKTEMAAVPTLTVTGTGLLTLTPDMATLSLGATTNSASAKDAISQNAELMDAITKAVLAEGISEEDIQTENYSIYQNYNYDPNTGTDTPGDYNVSNTLTVKVRDIKKLGSVIDSAGNAGMNHSYGIRFSMQDPNASRDELIKLAVADARSQAEAYAAALDKELGDVLSVANGTVSADVIYEERSVAAAEDVDAKAAPTSIQEGTLEQTCTVTICYRLG